MLHLLANIFTSLNYGLRVMLGAVVALLLVRMWRQGLIRTYWSVAGLLAVVAVQGFLRTWFEEHEAMVSFGAEIATVVLAAVLLWDLSRRTFANYPSLAAFAQQMVRYALPTCAGVAVISFWMDPNLPPDRSPVLQLFTRVDRAVESALLMFILVTGVFATWFPVGMKRNVARIVGGMVLLLAVDFACEWMANGMPRTVVPALALVQILVSMGVCAYWSLGLNRQGEQVAMRPRAAMDPQRLLDLTRQLDYMQAQLSRRGY
jgi:hypothetical protein